MANTSKSSLQNLLTALLAVANQDQNLALPPWVFTSMVNTATAFLLTECARLYPDNPNIVDIIDPFVKVRSIPPSNGVINLNIDGDYRNLLGSPMINVNPKGTGECGGAPEIRTADQFKASSLKAGCNRKSVTIVSQSEFAFLTSSSYKKPTYDSPIGYFSGQKQIKVCPYDLARVDVMYVRIENIYQFGYIMQPDDTYLFDPTTGIDTEWTNAAFPTLFRALNHLYGAYSRDKDFNNWAMILSEKGIL